MIQGFVFYLDSEKDCSRFRKQIIYNSEKYEKDKILYYEKYENFEYDLFSYILIISRVFGIIYDFRN